MQSSKRTLRSHEIPLMQSILTPNQVNANIANIGKIGVDEHSILETELDLNFSLQYPHFIKRDGNRFVFIWFILYIVIVVVR